MVRSPIGPCAASALALLLVPTCPTQDTRSDLAPLWREAAHRGDVFEECGRSARRVIQGWLDFRRDAATGLISRNPVFDYHNEAADHYSSLVLAAHYVHQDLNEPGAPLHRTLKAIQEHCLLPNGIPALYDLRAHEPREMADLGHLSEWLRDGLIRVVENKGTDNDWYRELVRLTDAMIEEAARRGGMVRAFPGPEPVGNMLQSLARLHALSGDARHLHAAEELADAYLLDPAHRIEHVRFIDHGCENVPGLAELFALECQLGSAKADEYRAPITELLDRILATGAHPETGLFCVRRDADDGTVSFGLPPDTWGYVLFAYADFDHATGEPRYAAAIEKPLRWLLEHRRRYLFVRTDLWPASRTRDNWSDSYESFSILWNRYPDVGDGAAWLDWATHRSDHRRFADQDYGPYYGDHFDGSTMRTLCMHMMLQSQGVRAVPFQEGLRLGAVQKDGALYLVLRSDTPWQGALCFDAPRGVGRAATLDWARINEMPAWFVVRGRDDYVVRVDGETPETRPGRQLAAGYPVELAAGGTLRLRVAPGGTGERR